MISTRTFRELTVLYSGTGNTLRFSCYNSSSDRTLGQLDWSIAGNSSDVAEGRLWGGTKILADNCYAAQNKTGNLVGTAFVARDMMKIVDALGEDGLLRYWGNIIDKAIALVHLTDYLRLLVRYYFGSNCCRHVPRANGQSDFGRRCQSPSILP
jgi:hypothetical protein